MQIYRTTPNDEKALTYLKKLGEDGWIYCGQLNDKLVFRKEEKKTINRKEIKEDQRFIEFYGVYPNKKDRKGALKAWCKLSEEDKTKAIENVVYYKQWCEEKYRVDKKLLTDKILHPSTYLNNARWNDNLEIGGKSKDQIIKEQETLEKRKKEEFEQKQRERIQEEQSQEILLIIRRLEERNKEEYAKLFNKAMELTDDGPMKVSIAKIRMRKIVNDNIPYYKEKIKLNT